jgi:allantoinase
LCASPARLIGLERRKGAIATGRDADIVIWDPERDFRVEQQMIHHRHKLSPYEGEVLQGVVEKTFLRGKLIYDDGMFVSETEGSFLANQTAEKEA